MAAKTLIFIPTYCERTNAPLMCEAIHKLGLDADLLFIDDNSPDGTAEALLPLCARYPRLRIKKRPGKMGIGSAHLEAINWAYDQGYEILVTMDCDFTHSPADIPKLMEAAQNAPLSIGSRWMSRGSLPGWNAYRCLMTHLGHLLTRTVLSLPFDASGAFRAYRLDRIPREIFKCVRAQNYSFFFESLFILHQNGIKVAEIPIVLPSRTYDSSKMTPRLVIQSVKEVFRLYFHNLRRPEDFLSPRSTADINSGLNDPQAWSAYWQRNPSTGNIVYELIAGFYRQNIIRPNLERVMRKTFPPHSILLHAGCGSGQVDRTLCEEMRISALDISPEALHLYARNNARAEKITHGSILNLPYPAASFDGIYNMGVMEHFTLDELRVILSEFHRVLKLNGTVVIFWPHQWAPSVLILKAAHFIFKTISRKFSPFHPREITLLKSRRFAEQLLQNNAFELTHYEYGLRDGCIQAVLVAKKRTPQHEEIP